MPNYDYECRNCGQAVEVFRRLSEFSDFIQANCPKCGEYSELDLIVSVPGVEDWGNDGQGRWFEHLGPEGRTFRDKRSYKEFLKTEGLQEWSPKRGMPGCDP